MTTQYEAEKNPVGTKEELSWLLHHGIKSLLRCDEAETVQGIARYVISKYRSLKAGSEFIEQNRQTLIPPIAAFLGAITRFLEVRVGHRLDGAVWIARLANERRVLETLPQLLPELDWIELKFCRRPDLASISALPKRLFPLRSRIFRLTRLLLRQEHKFFKVLRVMELIGYYTRYLEIFQKGNFSLAVMSSHSNPHGLAFNLAARRCNVPTVLITHGMPVRPVARLSYNLAVIHCEFARQIYSKAGCRMGQVIIHGRRQYYAPMPGGEKLPERLTIGIFLCKDVNEAKLDFVVKQLLNHSRVARILIRPHPKNLFIEFDEWFASLNDNRVCRSLNDSVSADLQESDIVLGGNSSVLVEAVTAGRPSGYIQSLDYGSFDLHEFVVRGLIYPVEDELDFDPDAILCFYQRSEWPSALRLYANVEDTEKAVANLLQSAIRELVAPNGPPGH